MKSHLLTFLLLLLLSTLLKAQHHVVTTIWEESSAIQHSAFGIITGSDANSNFYRCGTSSNSQGGNDCILESLNEEGDLNWSINLNTPSGDRFEPIEIVVETNIYLLGRVTYSGTSESDQFIAKISDVGNVEWMSIDSVSGQDIPADLTFNSGSNEIISVGTSNRNGTYDLVIQSHDDSGNSLWTNLYDYGFSDVAAKVYEESGQYYINGLSETSTGFSDLCTWRYTSSGSFIDISRSSGISTQTEVFRDGMKENSVITIVGSVIQSDIDARIITFDANNNVIWDHSYDHNALEDEYLTVLNTGLAIYAAGYQTDQIGNRDVLIQKYNNSGQLLWTTNIDYFHENDEVIDLLEDSDGNILALCNIYKQGQSDIELITLESATGQALNTISLVNNPSASEVISSVELAFNGNIIITYESDGISSSIAYGLNDVVLPADNLVPSSNYLLVESKSSIYNSNNQEEESIKYYSFGSGINTYYSGQSIDFVLNDPISNSNVQRIEISFPGQSNNMLGHLSESQMETVFNTYLGDKEYEGLKSFSTLCYPELFPDVDLTLTSTTEGLVWSFAIKSQNGLDGIQLLFDGASSVNLNNGGLILGTIDGDMEFEDPFSYTLGNPEIVDDDCIQFSQSENTISFEGTCEFQYPYIVQIRPAQNSSQISSTTLGNMDWSTFFGKRSNDYAFSMDAFVDATGIPKIMVGGQTYSSTFPLVKGQSQSTPGSPAILAQFDHFAILKWVSTIYTNYNQGQGAIITAINHYDNLSVNSPGDEIHVAGIFAGDLKPEKNFTFSLPSNPYQQTIQVNQQNALADAFFATYRSTDGVRAIISPFGGPGNEKVTGITIDANGLMYMYGSSTIGNSLGSNASNQSAPTTYNFPVYDPNDGSFYVPNFAGPDEKSFITVLNLNSYLLEYSSFIAKNISSTTTNPEISTIYDLKVNNNEINYCGIATNGGFIASINTGGQQMFASNLSHIEHWTNKNYFTSVEITPSGKIFLGLDSGGSDPLTSIPSGGRFISNNGESFMLFRDNMNITTWDTYFGDQSNQRWYWDRFYYSPNTEQIAYGRLLYIPSKSSLFYASTASGDPVPTVTHSGFFNQAVNSTTDPNSTGDIHLNSFYLDNSFTPFHSWGTMFGENDPSVSTAFAQNNSDFLSGIGSYEYNNELYLVVVGSTNSRFGTTSNNEDKFPISDYDPTSNLDWAVLDNSFQTGTSAIVSDIFITRFNITNLTQNGIGIDNYPQSQNISIYPNPTNDKVYIDSELGIQQMEVVDLSGKQLYVEKYPRPIYRTVIDLSNYGNGLYIIKLNDEISYKVSKE